MDLLAVLERVRWIENDPLVRLEAAEDLECGAKVSADDQWLEVGAIVGAYYDSAESFGPEQKRIDGNKNALARRLHLQNHLRISTW